MALKTESKITIQGARQNNLKDIALEIPHHQLIAVTGLSGSGKSSLVFDIIAQEGQRRYFETLPSFVRQFTGKLNRPNVDVLEGLSPVIVIGQSTAGMHARSTVGTMSDIYDTLRLLYARTGKTNQDLNLSRALFSFNSAAGKCPTCNGIGKAEEIDLNRLIIHPESSIRDGALAPTLPTGYIMYSQVTIDVLNQVCEAEGFNVDIPWCDLTNKQKNVILYGSNAIKVPFGKHSLESRLKWTGIKAKPREEGYYKGMIPIMSDILRRDRNANILKYVHAVTCQDCQGARLNDAALSVKVHDLSIAEIAENEISGLKKWIESHEWTGVGKVIIAKIISKLALLEDLGLGHLTLDRSAKTLRASEIQRIRIANQILMPLSDVLYVFDEPSIGLHPEENKRLIAHFKDLVSKGNTVIVVEHDLATIQAADYIVELGPEAGVNGGELLFSGQLSTFLKQKDLATISPTFRALKNQNKSLKKETITKGASLYLNGCNERNLKEIDVEFKLGKVNIVSGKSGTGKSSLVNDTLVKVVEAELGLNGENPPRLKGKKNVDLIDKLVFINHTPIGKTPRSNPATYLGLSDHIRDIYASLPESKAKGYTKSRFSFNNKGGRCETCQGAGKIQIGMHFLGHVDLVCGTCNGDRFNADTLAIKYNGLSIADVYKLTVQKALAFFADQKKLQAGLQVLEALGLGYLALGQSSTTLSGGEAQRIKLANQLQKKDTGHTLYVIIEPSIGLHQDNINTLLALFNGIKAKGNTIVCIEQDESVIQNSDWHIELGPKGGVEGGTILYQGTPRLNVSKTKDDIKVLSENKKIKGEIKLNGVKTHGLKNIDVCFPKNQLSVVTGVSGSGKSSLVYDTLFAEANARFLESLSTHNRSFIQDNSTAKMTSYSGLGPAIGISRKGGGGSKRSTVGTLSGLYDQIRLLYSRIAQHRGKNLTAQHFSFNHHLGACPVCEGVGFIPETNPNEIVVSPEQSILNGALAVNKALAYYADPNGQFMAILTEIGKQKQWDLSQPWQALDDEVKRVILYGTGDEIWDVNWTFTTKSRSGTQALSAKWLGFCRYIDEEFQRRKHNKNITQLEALLHDVNCPSCKGSRLKTELLNIRFLDKNIHELVQMDVEQCLKWLTDHKKHQDATISAISDHILPSVKNTMQTIIDLGLGHLNLNRSVVTLSGGERQRLTLTGQLSKQLYGVTYVLDEPTIGLDPKQVTILLSLLRRIVKKGNTLVVVEHDSYFIQQADYLIEMGPGAGEQGGAIVYQGKVEDVKKVPGTLTHKLFKTQGTQVISNQNKKGKVFGVKGAFANHLQLIDVDFYSQQITAIKGVSGSGKSSLIKSVLYKSWEKNRAVNAKAVHGLEQFESVMMVDQTALLQGRLSTPIVYTGLLEPIKLIFSKTATARDLGLKKTDFSYQSKGGKCPTCGGYGQLKTSMDFMSDIWLSCHDCHGQRYHKKVLSCQYNGLSIGEVLGLTVDRALTFFKQNQQIYKGLKILDSLGLGHLVLGQSGHTLSGGEAQRLKLAKSMLTKRKGAVLYLFDEPSTGLHYFDILELMKVFQSLIDQGDTVVFIEHHSTLIQSADRCITLGPDSGEAGGRLV